MTPPTSYDMFVANELDPVSCLEPYGINEKNKTDPSMLASVLASLGSFKDKKYRLKIRKDQVLLIHAVRILLETAAAEQKLGKRKDSDEESERHDSESDSHSHSEVEKRVKAKRQKVCDSESHSIGNKTTQLGIDIKKVSRDIQAHLCCNKLALDESDVTAILTLANMMNSRVVHGGGGVKSESKKDAYIVTHTSSSDSGTFQKRKAVTTSKKTKTA